MHKPPANKPDNLIGGFYVSVQQERLQTRPDLIRYLGKDYGPIKLRGIRNNGLPGTGPEFLIYEVPGVEFEVAISASLLSEALYNDLVLDCSQPYPPPAPTPPMHWAEHERRHKWLREYENEELARHGIDGTAFDRDKHAPPLVGKAEFHPPQGVFPLLQTCERGDRHYFLTSQEFDRAYRANHLAWDKGCPLNAHTVISWSLYGVVGDQAFKAYDHFRGLFTHWANSKGIEADFISVMECGPVIGLHSHFRCHAPISLKSAFGAWIPGAVKRAVAQAQGISGASRSRRLSDVGMMPFAEVLDRSRRRVEAPVGALNVTVRDPDRGNAEWRDFGYTMKTLSWFAATTPPLRHLGYCLHGALHLPASGNAYVPRDARRLSISRSLGPKIRSLIDVRVRELGASEEELVCPIDKRVLDGRELFVDGAEPVASRYRISISLASLRRPGPDNDPSDTFSGMPL